ncbi:P-loop containing nucleoside triphosphate hydrolase protein [Gaertneriomyces semiglobifer]|nr:P-loop containing nucleoside triphosphate hydrolase protein [Gaertneriomyces semiglobifer]
MFLFTEYEKVLKDMKATNFGQFPPIINELAPWILKVLKSESEKPAATDDEVIGPMEVLIDPDIYAKLMPFQKTGVLQAIKRDGRILLGDEMGLGKTIQALAICSYYRTEWPVLIICPSSLRLTWAGEIQKWLSVPDDKIQVVFQGKDRLSRQKHFIITSYDLASRESILAQLRDCRYKIVVADESHYLKSKDAKRTKSLLPLIKDSKRALLLSGTPALSRPVELYTQLSALIQPFTSQTQFGVRYCSGKRNKFGWDFTGSSNTHELHWFMEKTVLIRRLKKDVLSELPSKMRQCVYVEIPANAKKKMDKLKETSDALDDIVEQAKASKNSVQERDAALAKKQNYIELYSETGVAKLPAVKEYLQELYTNTNRKFIVFAHHAAVVSELSTFFEDQLDAKYIKIDGHTAQEKRQGLCDIFQTSPDTRVALLSITAAGVGLTLHAADLVIFAELFWNPAQLLQGEDRAHRIGRQGTVDVKYVLAKGTLDDVQWPLISRKLNVIGESIDGVRGGMETVDDINVQQEKEKKKQGLLDTFLGLSELMQEEDYSQVDETGDLEDLDFDDLEKTAYDIVARSQGERSRGPSQATDDSYSGTHPAPDGGGESFATSDLCSPSELLAPTLKCDNVAPASDHTHSAELFSIASGDFTPSQSSTKQTASQVSSSASSLRQQSNDAESDVDSDDAHVMRPSHGKRKRIAESDDESISDPADNDDQVESAHLSLHESTHASKAENNSTSTGSDPPIAQESIVVTPRAKRHRRLTLETPSRRARSVTPKLTVPGEEPAADEPPEKSRKVEREAAKSTAMPQPLSEADASEEDDDVPFVKKIRVLI